jgi:Ca-activated chloride channel homolog
VGTERPRFFSMIPYFTYPWAMLLLSLVPLLSWLYAQHAPASWLFSDRRLLPSFQGVRARKARWGGLVLRAAGLTFAILALSGPRWADETTRLPTEGISIAMVVDVSVSMGEEDFDWQNKKISRLLGVEQIFRLFVVGGVAADGSELTGRPNDLIALVTFATHPETACPLTLDHKALIEILNWQKPRTAATDGTTNPGDAIAWGLHLLEKAPTRRKVLVFLTDGESNVPKKLTPRQSAQLAANLSIPIYAIDASPTPKNQAEAAEAAKARDTMQAISTMTEGEYFRAQDGPGLVNAYKRIDRLERDRIVSFEYRRYYEGYAWFALAALACFVGLIGMEATHWRQAP